MLPVGQSSGNKRRACAAYLGACFCRQLLLELSKVEPGWLTGFHQLNSTVFKNSCFGIKIYVKPENKSYSTVTCVLIAARTVGGNFSFPCLECAERPQCDRLECGSDPW